MLEISRKILSIAQKACPLAEWIGVKYCNTKEVNYSMINNVFDSVSNFDSEGVFIEVLVNGQFGYYATANLTEDAIIYATRQAYSYAKAASLYSVKSFDISVRPPTKAHWETPRKYTSGQSVDFFVDFLTNASKNLHVNDKIVQTIAACNTKHQNISYVSSNGAEIYQTQHHGGVNFTVFAQDGAVVQRRSLNGPRGLTRQGGYELFESPSLLEEAHRVGTEAIELLYAEDCPSLTCDLVLNPDQMMLQIHESVGHPLELDRILGDERNFAGASFIKLSDIGTFQYGSKLMNITFDPTIQGELASYAVDEIGNPAVKEFIVKDGILVRALGSLESQKRSGKLGVANMRSQDWNRAPIDRMANLNLEPGSSTLNDIISSIEHGVYMEANKSWSIDDYRNKFQFGCEYGKLIEQGKLTKTVRNPNYRGISSNFWRNLFMVGDKNTFKVYGTPNCGKGEPNQIITVGHASPVCAFRNVEVFGGGK